MKRVKVLTFVFILNTVEAMLDSVIDTSASTVRTIDGTCPIECDKPRVLDRNCLSCYAEESTTIQDVKMQRTSTSTHNKMSCLYWQEVCIKQCSEKKQASKEPPTAYEIYICENKCKSDWYCVLERYDAVHNNRRVYESNNDVN